MDGFEPKKLALIRILQILRRYSDEEHPLKQEDIARHLEDDYGIYIERKAIGRNVALLKDAGYEIESGRDGSFLSVRDFTDAELRVLIDGVLSSKYITASFSKELIDKLCSLSNKYFRSHVKHVHSLNDWDKTENYAFFSNIELVDEAIEAHRQIVFDYNKYGADKKLHLTHTHKVSPYQLILHNQRYYLMARSEKWENVTFYRLDRITNMKLTDEKLFPITEVEGYKNGINYKNLSTALPYMYHDKPERVDFIAGQNVIDDVIDWFGKDVRITKSGDVTYRVSVTVSPMAMEHWAMQYAGRVRIISPEPLANKIKERLASALKDYEPNG